MVVKNIQKILCEQFADRIGQEDTYRIVLDNNISKEELTDAISHYASGCSGIFNPDTLEEQTIDEFVDYFNKNGIGAFEIEED